MLKSVLSNTNKDTGIHINLWISILFRVDFLINEKIKNRYMYYQRMLSVYLGDRLDTEKFVDSWSLNILLVDSVLITFSGN